MNVPWSVSVEVAGERILTLCSDGSMAGIDDIQEEDDCVIQLAGEALLAFVNKPVWPNLKEQA